MPARRNAMDPFNQDLLRPTEHDLAANKRDGWVNPNIMGETERDPQTGVMAAGIKELRTPDKLPPRKDVQRHLSDEALDLISEAKTASLHAQATSLVASASKLAWSSAIKQEVLRRWGREAGMPKTQDGRVDEAALGQFLDEVERLVPPGPKAKAYILYLCGQHFGFNPPAWQPGEDDAVIRPLMFNFDKLVTRGKLTGQAADVNSYKALDRLKSTVNTLMDEGDVKPGGPDVSDEIEASKPRFDVHRTKYLPQDIADIKAGSTIIAEAGGWAVYKIPFHPGEAGKVAAQLLCNNGINKVSWCVGRGTIGYLDQGPFYVLVKDGRSQFAISTKSDEKTATVWNPADTPVWVTTSGTEVMMPRLTAVAKAKGIPLDLTKVSSLPAAIIPALDAATKADPELAAMIPPTHLVQGDTTSLDKAIMAAPTLSLVQDLATGFASERTTGIAAAVMGRCIALHYDFSPEYSEFDEPLLVAYIELLAAAGQGLPKSLEAAIIQAIKSAE